MEDYNLAMKKMMRNPYEYHHELGMNYTVIADNLIVGSQPQKPEDINFLKEEEGVAYILNLQQDKDVEYWGIDLQSIIERCKELGIHHMRQPAKDFDPDSLRTGLPKAVSLLEWAISKGKGKVYVHCTAGLGRAPAVAMAYMFWVQGYQLNEALELLLSKRSCFPKIDAIKSATADILSGFKKKPVALSWEDDQCSTVEVAGLDIGWGQRIPLKFDEARGAWILNRELAEGRYEYKYIIDGIWTCNKNEPVTPPNQDGHVNNFIEVIEDEDPGSDRAILRRRLIGDEPELTAEERSKIRQFLEACPDEI